VNKAGNLAMTAFFLIALFGGGNAVAVRFSNAELAPFWGATIRFAGAGSLFWLILILRRIPLPHKRDAVVLLLTGFFTSGVSFAFIYLGLVKVPASLGSVIISLGPLMTLFLAIAHRIESFRGQSLLGGLIALIGIAIASRAQLGAEIPLVYLLSLVAGSAIGAEGNVILKIFSPKSNPIATNALTLAAGLVFLALASVFYGETHNIPVLPATWMAIGYVVIFGSLVMFSLFIWLLGRWSASATSYAIMLFPIVGTLGSVFLLGEKITPAFILGGVLVLVGVWIGALMNQTR
jgi:drug/metabolite transporter (DMT)-like permease